jgi:hypothetical protein
MPIPISFEYEGVFFEGYFSNELGIGFDYYGLNLNGVHYGSMIIKKTGWVWAAGPMRMFEEPYMVEYFISVIEKHLKGAG